MLDSADTMRRFGVVARGIMRQFVPPNSCIAGTRIAEYVLAGVYGLRFEHFATQLIVEAPTRKYVYAAGFEGTEKDEMSAACVASGGRWEDRADINGDGWAGHVVAVVGGRFFLDCSIDQASSAEFGLVLPQVPMTLDLGPNGERELSDKGGIEAVFSLEDNAPLKIRWNRIEKRDYIESEAWKDDGLMTVAVMIAAAMEVV